ncbi:hypothetical protein J3Q64DRAFT_1823819 [Phycomyces blakesleeanus]|uniref:C2H2-type zinc finger transcription factor n=2 Tax=Phycomyces blakesleeanus TaxID=4837 RepID=A0A167REN4_PHYB8|nr:C2H2-type zinc finger transcription factor [Phycomyces blakesleeanus NRRL 1555(-)]XP_018299514.1 C2H2-type zinc finger transcription factor [Phycomyces blakesleeanus NRRL 1555(-)]OAD81466.1 C2H2-type zinc finger transcription factor [Phycomyces blakesleeanus NRRL 1555(-)]OAD81474.1 C2H2-type zinc finger transcription factor [Phycomyces blakesleeanus NRRL 1555(-)]|eukprot:XP_018299506.1 C2H2-type zinc finger transcription factor [Phycomyces blakesleeanus NRRL 1555(-)]
MFSPSHLPTGQYYCVQPLSTLSVSNQEWLDYGYLDGDSTRQPTYPFQKYESRTQQNSSYVLSREQWKNDILEILAVPIFGDNIETYFQGSSSLPPLGPTSPGSSQGHYESDYDHQPETPQQHVQYDPTDIVIIHYDPHNPSRQNIKTSSPSSTNMYRCTVCPYETDKKFNFARHLETHSDVKILFCCPKCPNTYSTKHNLQRHTDQRRC